MEKGIDILYNRSWKTPFLLLLILVSLTVACGPQPAAANAPVTIIASEDCDASSAQLAAIKAVKKKIAALRDELRAPGLSAAIMPDESCVYRILAGYSDLEAQTPLSPDDKFLAASIGKSFVAAVAIDMAIHDELDLDAPASTWLGDRSWFSQIPNAETLTVRMLLNHTAGIPNHVGDPAFRADIVNGIKSNPDFAPSHEALVRYVADKTPLSIAGLEHHYADTNYILAGLIIEAASGASYYDNVRCRFLTPLRLDDTVPSDRRQIPNLVAGYWDEEDDYFELGDGASIDNNGALKYNPAIEWTGGGLASTPADLARWMRLLFSGAAMDKVYWDELFVTAPVHASDEERYGLGAGIWKTNAGKLYGHSGGIPGYTSFAGYLPDLDIAFAFMLNQTRSIIPSATSLAETINENFADQARNASAADATPIAATAGRHDKSMSEQCLSAE